MRRVRSRPPSYLSSSTCPSAPPAPTPTCRCAGSRVPPPRCAAILKIVDGRMFEWGKNEVIVGVGANNARICAELEVGGTVKVGRATWPVVGVFSGQRGHRRIPEIWTDAKVLQAAYNRGDSFQAVYARLNSAGAFRGFKGRADCEPAAQRQGAAPVGTLRRAIAGHHTTDHHAGFPHRPSSWPSARCSGR